MHTCSWLTFLPALMSADVLVLTFDGELEKDAVTTAIAPIELRPDNDGMPATEAVVTRFPRQPGQGDVSIEFRAFGADGVSASESIVQPGSWWMVRNEVDTLRDLELLFGIPADGLRAGGRRHVQAVMDAVAGAEVSPLAFDGELLRWIGQRPWSDDELATLRSLGGTWAEYQVIQDPGLRVRELVAVMAGERRRQLLEPGFERAGVSLLRGWMEAVVRAAQGDGERADRCAQHHRALLEQAVTAVGAAAPNRLDVYDPPPVREASLSLTRADADTAERRAGLEAALVAALDAAAGGKRGRVNVHEAHSGVDPSEIASVWLDVLLAARAFEDMDDGPALGFVSAAYAHTEPTGPADVRRNDHVDLAARIEQVQTDLFASRGDPDAAWRNARFDRLWELLLGSAPVEEPAAEARARWMGIAGWGTPSGLERWAERLRDDMVRAADELLVYEEQAGNAAGEESPQDSRSAHARKRLETHLTIARAMAASTPRDGVDPAGAIEARFDELAASVQQADPEPPPEYVLLLRLWEEGQ